MTAWAPTAREQAVLRRPRVRQRRLAGGVVWIVVLALLLTGVVALNVAVLRLNMQLEQLARERATLRAQNALLAAQVASAVAPARVEGQARRRGLVQATNPSYVDLSRAR